MSITNQSGATLKAFAKMTRNVRVIDGEVLHTGDTVETAYPHHNPQAQITIQSPRGRLVPLNPDEATIVSDDQDATAAFTCLVTTLRSVLALGSDAMDDEDRARTGRWLLGELIKSDLPHQSRTIRDLTVGELIDLLHDAQAHCIVI